MFSVRGSWWQGANAVLLRFLAVGSQPPNHQQGLTVALFPLTVVKTRQMALPDAPRGVRGAWSVGRDIVRSHGVRGLYCGLGTVVCGIIPARGAYLTTLEAVKSAAEAQLETAAPALGDAQRAAAANLVGGAAASLATQVMTVPVDVVSQRLMVQQQGPIAASSSKRAPPPPIRGGVAMARAIIAAEGVRGLFRGFGASVATFVPSSAVWWSAYGGYQRALWHAVDDWGGDDGSSATTTTTTATTVTTTTDHSSSQILAVQTAAALAAGCTSATLTTPLDVVKTRLQVAGAAGAARPTATAVLKQLLAEDGFAGLFRGLGPRTASVALWGTCMVNAYEGLKRAAARD